MKKRVIFNDHYNPVDYNLGKRKKPDKIWLRKVSEKTGEEYGVDFKWKKVRKRVVGDIIEIRDFFEVSLWKKRKHTSWLKTLFPWKQIYYHRFFGAEWVLRDPKVIDRMIQHSIQNYEKYFQGQAIKPLQEKLEGKPFSSEMLLGSFVFFLMTGVAVFVGWLPLRYIVHMFIGGMTVSFLLFMILKRFPIDPSHLETTVEMEESTVEEEKEVMSQ